MADYGVQITGNNGIYQLDSEENTTAHLAMQVDNGSASAGATLNDIATGDFVIARPAANSSGHVQYSTLEKKFKNAVQYKVLRGTNSASTVSTSKNGSIYGVRIQNADQTKTLFDSRSFSKGFEVKQVSAQGAFPGGTFQSGNSTYLADNLIYTAASSAAFNKTFVMATGGQYFLSGSNDIVVNGFYFDNSTYKIYYVGYYIISIYYGDVIPNYGEIIIGEIVE
tara:strand:+ start:1535 stop:2206 length:672 start_codon:yes stop_codon:yes gene_type:complete